MRSRINQELYPAGFVDVGPSPSFLIPVFTDDRDLYLQVTDSFETVRAFAPLAAGGGSQIRQLQLHAPDQDRRSAIGAPALYGFQPEAGMGWLDHRRPLADRLKQWPKRHEADPMLQLELVEFANGSPVELEHAVNRCELMLARAGLSQCRDWAKDQRKRLSLPLDGRLRAETFADSLLEPSQQPLLLLVHLTNAFHLRQILIDGQIRGRESPVSRESLTYFFMAVQATKTACILKRRISKRS